MAFSPSILTNELPRTLAIRAPPNTLPLGSASGRTAFGSITAPISPFNTVTFVLPRTSAWLPPPYTLPPILICPCATIVLRSIIIIMVIYLLISSILNCQLSINNNRWIVQIWLRQHIQVCRLDGHVNRISFATFCHGLVCQHVFQYHGVRGFTV